MRACVSVFVFNFFPHPRSCCSARVGNTTIMSLFDPVLSAPFPVQLPGHANAEREFARAAPIQLARFKAPPVAVATTAPVAASGSRKWHRADPTAGNLLMLNSPSIAMSLCAMQL